MKILQVYPYSAPAWTYGGIVPYVRRLSVLLSRRGHDVSVYTTNASDPGTESPRALTSVTTDGVHIRYFKNLSNTLASEHGLTLPLGMLPAVRRNLRQFDVIHLHGLRDFQNITVHRYATKYHIPYVQQAHGSLPAYIDKKLPKDIFDLLWGNRLVRDATGVIALNQTEADHYSNRGVAGGNIFVIPNGIDCAEHYRSLELKGTAEGSISIHKEHTVMYLGRLHKSKGLDILLKAVAEASRTVDDIRLLLVGPDDGYGCEIARMAESLGISNRVVMTGFVDALGKQRAFDSSQVFVTPKFYGFPTTFLESCINGMPIVTTSEGDSLDWIDEVGFTTNYDPKDISEAILKILTDTELRQILSQRCRDIVRERFDWEVIVDKIEEVYDICRRGVNGEGT